MSQAKTFLGDYLQPVMTITVETMPLPTTLVTVDRPVSTSAYCGELLDMSIIVNNTGTSDANITYIETLPENTLVLNTVNGDVKSNVITFKGIIWKNTSRNFSYTMTNLDCISKSWDAKYSITSYNSTSAKAINNISLLMLDIYSINESLTPNRTNTPSGKVEYVWAITNLHPSLSLSVDALIIMPRLVVNELSANIRESGNNYQYIGSVPVGNTLKLYFSLNAPGYGNYNITNVGTIDVDDKLLYYNSSRELKVLAPNMTMSMDVNTSLNNTARISITAVNNNVNEKYYYIYGNLKGFTSDEPVYYNGLDPGAEAVIFNTTYNTTGMGVKNYTIVFDGVYRDKFSVEYKLHVQKTFATNSREVQLPNIQAPANTATKTGNTSIPIIQNTASPNSSTITPASTAASNTSKDSNNNKDIITIWIESLSKFLQSIFG